MEPFDEGFDRHIHALSGQNLTLDGEVADKRREEPERQLKLLESVLERQRAFDEKEGVELARMGGDMEVSLPEERTCFCVCSGVFVGYLRLIVECSVRRSVHGDRRCCAADVCDSARAAAGTRDMAFVCVLAC